MATSSLLAADPAATSHLLSNSSTSDLSDAELTALATARNDWLTTVSTDFVALATSSAQASADFNKALAAALAKQATAQGTADMAFTVAADGLEWSLISGSASAEWGYSIGLIARENVFAASRAAADKTVDVAYAEAGRQSEIDYATAEKSYQVALATIASNAATQRAAAEGTLATAKIDAIQTGEDSSLAAAIAAHDTANETAWEAQSLARRGVVGVEGRNVRG